MNTLPFSVTDSERRRLQDAFRRLGGGGGGSGGTVGKSVFVSDVLGAGFPAGLAGMHGIVLIDEPTFLDLDKSCTHVASSIFCADTSDEQITRSYV